MSSKTIIITCLLCGHDREIPEEFYKGEHECPECKEVTPFTINYEKSLALGKEQKEESQRQVDG